MHCQLACQRGTVTIYWYAMRQSLWNFLPEWHQLRMQSSSLSVLATRLEAQQSDVCRLLRKGMCIFVKTDNLCLNCAQQRLCCMCHLQGEERLLCPNCPQASPRSHTTPSHMTPSRMMMTFRCQIAPAATQSLVGALQVWPQVLAVLPGCIPTAVYMHVAVRAYLERQSAIPMQNPCITCEPDMHSILCTLYECMPG